MKKYYVKISQFGNKYFYYLLAGISLCAALFMATGNLLLFLPLLFLGVPIRIMEQGTSASQDRKFHEVVLSVVLSIGIGICLGLLIEGLSS